MQRMNLASEHGLSMNISVGAFGQKSPGLCILHVLYAYRGQFKKQNKTEEPPAQKPQNETNGSRMSIHIHITEDLG